jgi:HD-GYP domain-containing protein (c-di-GMP phosphodiesterase class II)
MGPPTPEEWAVVKRHCAEGARIVGYVKELSSIVPVILHHHEWYDGTGYPDGLKGSEIPLGARITSVADAYDTMITQRPYRHIVAVEEACRELRRCAAIQFDPELVEVWCRLVEEAEKKK